MGVPSWLSLSPGKMSMKMSRWAKVFRLPIWKRGLNAGMGKRNSLHRNQEWECVPTAKLGLGAGVASPCWFVPPVSALVRCLLAARGQWVLQDLTGTRCGTPTFCASHLWMFAVYKVPFLTVNSKKGFEEWNPHVSLPPTLKWKVAWEEVRMG